MDWFFILDTSTGRQTRFSTYDEFLSKAQDLKIKLSLEPIRTVYSKFRFTWLDVFAGTVSLAPPAIGFLILIWWVRRLSELESV